jgi:coatomer protein complex subunit gamma
MVTNSVTKDITSNSSFNAKVNALRLLPMFVSAQNPVQIERMLKDNLIDKNPEVVEAALMALYEIQKAGNQELVKKCSVEIESLLKNDSLKDISYVALNVLLNVRSEDNIIFLKNFSNYLKKIIKGNGKDLKALSDFSVLQILKGCTSLILSPDPLDRSLLESMLIFLELALDRKSDMIKIECTRMLSFMDNVDNSSMKPFVRELKELLEWNEDAITHYETLKVLEFIIRNPYRLSLFTGHSIFDNLLNSDSKMVVSLAITILIKVANESNIERLLDKIFKIMNDVPDNIKERVVTNCLLVLEKYPSKLVLVISFLNNCLRDKGEVDFKLKVISILEQILEKFEHITENVLDFLSEYIEDSMDPQLTVKIIVIISKFNSKIENKGKYVKFLINRISLDTSDVRAASISALGLISFQDPGLSGHILNILRLFQDDKDSEEVGYRAAYFMHLLEEEEASEKVESQSEKPSPSSEDTLDVDHLDGLLSQLDGMMTEGSYDMQTINLFSMENASKKKETKVLTKTERIQQKHTKKESKKKAFSGSAQTGDAKVNAFLKTKLGEDIGDCVFSSGEVKLSEEDFEYYVRARKHVFGSLIVIEFIVENNSENQIEKIKIKLGKSLMYFF